MCSKATIPTIPKHVKMEVAFIVGAFNKKVVRDPNRHYVPRYRGNYLYLDRFEPEFGGQVCRLEYTGDMSKWKFAIYRHSSLRYDPDEWLFSGAGYVDGTVEGAMRAGMEAYP